MSRNKFSLASVLDRARAFKRHITLHIFQCVNTLTLESEWKMGIEVATRSVNQKSKIKFQQIFGFNCSSNGYIPGGKSGGKECFYK